MGVVYLFPYSEVKENSRIAIYGTGAVGKDYVFQLRQTNYCRISFIATRKTDDKRRWLRGYELVLPDAFQERKDFDYVALSSVNTERRQKIIERLISWGIPQEKIIFHAYPSYFPGGGYSQHGEDHLIFLAFQHMGFFQGGRIPTYIDIGAHHPYDLSNTALFYQMGCHGVNVEANPELIKSFETERPDDINLCVGIGPQEGEMPFYIADEPALSTFKKDNLEYNRSLCEYDTGTDREITIKKTCYVKIRRLEDIINEYCDGIWPDFMSMDIEGMEFDSLASCDLSKGPALIVIEVNNIGNLFIKMMDGKGYFPYLWYRENIIFVRNDYKDMVHACSKP